MSKRFPSFIIVLLIALILTTPVNAQVNDDLPYKDQVIANALRKFRGDLAQPQSKQVEESRFTSGALGQPCNVVQGNSTYSIATFICDEHSGNAWYIEVEPKQQWTIDEVSQKIIDSLVPTDGICRVEDNYANEYIHTITMICHSDTLATRFSEKTWNSALVFNPGEFTIYIWAEDGVLNSIGVGTGMKPNQR